MKTNFNQKSVDLSKSSSITNSIATYIINRFDPIVKRLGNLELQIESNERLIQNLKTNIDTMSKNINVNTEEYEKCFNILKNILFNSNNLFYLYSKAIKKIVDMVRNSNIDLISLFKEYDIDNDGIICG